MRVQWELHINISRFEIHTYTQWWLNLSIFISVAFAFVFPYIVCKWDKFSYITYIVHTYHICMKLQHEGG